MVLVYFLALKIEMGLSCTIYKIPLNFSLSLVLKPGTGNPAKWYRKFRKNFTGMNRSVWILHGISAFSIQMEPLFVWLSRDWPCVRTYACTHSTGGVGKIRPSLIVLLKVAYYATSSPRNFAKLCQNYARIPKLCSWLPKLCSQNDVDSVHIGAQ